MRTIRKYLSTRAEACAVAKGLDAYEHVVVVPAYGEGALPALHEALPANTLLVLIVNAPPDAPADKLKLNAETLTWARSLGSEVTALQDTVVRADPDVLIVERTFPAKQGVGAARNFGGDIALSLYEQGKLSVPFIFMTDADAVPPRDYLSRIELNHAACVYPFAHEPLHPAITAYEIALRYYVAGLRWAGSPYAFHTIGSCMALHVESYAAVRGVPLRNAAEDFYLLNKVRKVGSVASLAGEPIVLSGRGSDRVPFGTGRAVLDYDGQPRLYDPRCFEVVKRARHALLTDSVAAFVAWGQTHEGFDDAIAPLDFAGASSRANQQTRSDDARRKHIDAWFDAFAQRKLVHRIRDNCWPSPPLEAALDAAPFVEAADALDPTLQRMRQVETTC